MSKPTEITGQPGSLNRQSEAQDYLEIHKINELFSNITSHLVFNKPGSRPIFLDAVIRQKSLMLFVFDKF